ncbi:Nif3-like dinuclear metal center hexameric protein [Thermoleophilum album]|uniref:GTP cyclohydrolase 1 type 2 homolog n=1 Tax=Thermoleophilum album TaxID=29539 RepID=A0A1H6FM73_THEAL|nr:Nif3-like dinuclear metal center hexameric protein [Thermoleophilum album]SEH11956.1 dinuclear metal center protein, YbgI/SA1388 family [Thermoleophilum album]
MPTVEEIVAHLDALLDVRQYTDWCPNGLQVAATEDRQVSHVATCVSAHAGTLARAVEIGAELVLAHHGLFWGSGPTTIAGPLRERLRTLLAADVALAAYHLPLDAHPEIGNNVLLARALGLNVRERFAEVRGHAIGFVAEADPPLTIEELVQRCRELSRREPLCLPFGPPLVRRVGVVSGAGAEALTEARTAGIDALLTGEPREAAFAEARERGVHFLAAGHYATETLGIQRLGEVVAARFGVRHSFVDFPNPI